MNSKVNQRGIATLYIVIIGIVITLLIGIGCIFLFNGNPSEEEEEVSSGEKFKESYEVLNDKKDENGNTYLPIQLTSYDLIHYSTEEEVLTFLEKGTGVLYFGTPSNQSSRFIVPILFDAANEIGLEQINYYDASAIRDQKKLDTNDTITTVQEGTDTYYKIVDLLKEQLPVYEGLKDDSIKRLYFPTVVFLKQGRVIDLYTMDEDMDDFSELSVATIKQNFMDKMQDLIVCDDLC